MNRPARLSARASFAISAVFLALAALIFFAATATADPPDTNAPEVFFSSPTEAESINDNSPDVVFYSTDESVVATTCSVDGAAATACDAILSIEHLDDGAHSVTVTATDVADNTGASSINFSVDTVAPPAPVITMPAGDLVADAAPAMIAGTSEPGAFITAYNYAFNYSDSDADGSGNWQIDEATSEPAADTYSITATATDAAGNASVPSSARIVTVDTTNPVVEITSMTEGESTADADPLIYFDFVEAHPLTTECSIDGAPPASCSSPYEPGELTEGLHTVVVRHIDAVDNHGSALVNFEIDAGTSPKPCTKTTSQVSASIASGSNGSHRSSIVSVNLDSDRATVAKVSIESGRSILYSQVVNQPAGGGRVAIRMPRLPASRRLALRVDVLTRGGIMPLGSDEMFVSRKGAVRGGNISGSITGACAQTNAAFDVAMNAPSSRAARAGAKGISIGITAMRYSLSTLSINQHGKTIARKVVLISPGVPMNSRVALLAGRQLTKGTAVLNVSSVSADGEHSSKNGVLRVR